MLLKSKPNKISNYKRNDDTYRKTAREKLTNGVFRDILCAI